MKRFILVILSLSLLALICFGNIFQKNPVNLIEGQVEIDKIKFNSDKNSNGNDDPDDILIGARQEVYNKPQYKSEYYNGGFPPASEGVCTDVIWRALNNAGYNLKMYIDDDIKNNLNDYSASIKTPDPNIDFRRVKNQYIFFKRAATSLTTNVIPDDKNNLIQWQRGDIVVLERSDHIGIVSDKRRKDGVPYIIHSANSYPKEEDVLMEWSNNKRILGHFRFPKE
jgi:uncharacterized protein YijF (DUF1287 family)